MPINNPAHICQYNFTSIHFYQQISKNALTYLTKFHNFKWKISRKSLTYKKKKEGFKYELVSKSIMKLNQFVLFNIIKHQFDWKWKKQGEYNNFCQLYQYLTFPNFEINKKILEHLFQEFSIFDDYLFYIKLNV